MERPATAAHGRLATFGITRSGAGERVGMILRKTRGLKARKGGIKKGNSWLILPAATEE